MKIAVVTYARIDLGFFFSIYTVTVEQFTCQLVSLFFINMFHLKLVYYCLCIYWLIILFQKC